ncbi:MAG TPA: transcriptional repressor [Candidatus Limnocylindrales bacterium]|nr:transcriptional repressor [Candidatus Limnocylindrales bacterium]
MIYGHKYKRSRQRERILSLLQHTDTHPTAGWLYEQLKEELAGLSLGTVYRNINILVDQKLIKKIEAGSGFDRYDANIASHYHFICQKCCSVMDIPMPLFENLDEEAALASGHLVNGHQIDFHGICSKCSK